jgi:hypothetical protein
VIEIIREGLSGPISWYHGVGTALAVTLVAISLYLRTRSKPTKPPTVDAFPALVWTWLAMSVFWIIGVFYAESLDGLLTHELGETLTTAFLPTVVPPLILASVARILASLSRP